MSNQPSSQPPTYPAIRFLTAWGGLLAVLLGLVPPLLAVLAVLEGVSVLWLLAGAVAGAVLWLVARSYVEVLRILSDTLMPR